MPLLESSHLLTGAEWLWIIFIIFILVIIVIIVIIRAIVKRVAPTAKKRHLDTIRDRLAKGEISKEEYDNLKKEF